MIKILALSAFAFFNVHAYDFNAAWIDVARNEAASRHRDVAEKLAEIEKQSREAERYDQWLRAFSAWFRILPVTEKIDPVELLPIFADFAARVPQGGAPVANLAMAHLLGGYYEDNRKVIDARKGSGAADVAQWSKVDFDNAIWDYFCKVLADEHLIANVSAHDYREVLADAQDDGSTLWDWVLRDMISYLELSADSGIGEYERIAFLPDEEFMAAAPPLEKVESPFDRALALFAKRLRFHRKDKDLLEFAVCDLERLLFCARHRPGSGNARAYIAALDRYIAKWRRFETSAQAAAIRATLAAQAGENAIAGILASRAAAAFPMSEGGSACKKLIEQLELPSLSMSVPLFWGIRGAEIEAEYKNLEAVYLRAVKINTASMLQLKAGLNVRREVLRIFKSKGGKSWSQLLPASVDNTLRKFTIPVNENLKSGHYLLFISPEAEFVLEKCAFVPITIGNHTMAVKCDSDGIGAILFNRTSGLPEKLKRAVLWKIEEGRLKVCKEGSIDDSGHFGFNVKRGRYLLNAGDRTDNVISDIVDLNMATAGEVRKCGESADIKRNPAARIEVDDDFLTANEPIRFRLSVASGKGRGGNVQGKLSVFAARVTQSDGDKVSGIEEWEAGSEIATHNVEVGENGARGSLSLDTGAYVFQFENLPGRVPKFKVRKNLFVFNPESNRFPLPLASYAAFGEDRLAAGEEARLYWGSGRDRAAGVALFERKGRILKSSIISGESPQGVVKYKVGRHDETVDVHILSLDNRHLHAEHRRISVTNSQKRLTLSCLAPQFPLLPGSNYLWRVEARNSMGSIVSNAHFTAVFRKSSLDTAEAAPLTHHRYRLQTQYAKLKVSGSGVSSNTVVNCPPKPIWKPGTVRPWSRICRSDAAEIADNGKAPSVPNTVLPAKKPVAEAPRVATAGKDGFLELLLPAPAQDGEYVLDLTVNGSRFSRGSLRVPGVEVLTPLSIGSHAPTFVRKGDFFDLTFEVTNNSLVTQKCAIALSGSDALPAERSITNEVLLAKGQVHYFTAGFAVTNDERSVAFSCKAAIPGFNLVKTGKVHVVASELLRRRYKLIRLRGGDVSMGVCPLDAGGEEQISLQSGNCALEALYDRIEQARFAKGSCSEQIFADSFMAQVALRLAEQGRLYSNRLERTMLERNISESNVRLGRLLLPCGMWPWYEGGADDVWTTMRILAGAGQLAELAGGKPKVDLKALQALDRWMVDVLALRRRAGDEYPFTPAYLESLALYARSFYPDIPYRDAESAEAFGELKRSTSEKFLQMGDFSLVCAGLAARNMREGELEQKIISALKERFSQASAIPPGIAASLLALLPDDASEKLKLFEKMVSEWCSGEYVAGLSVADALYAMAKKSDILAKSAGAGRFWFESEEVSLAPYGMVRKANMPVKSILDLTNSSGELSCINYTMGNVNFSGGESNPADTWFSMEIVSGLSERLERDSSGAIVKRSYLLCRGGDAEATFNETAAVAAAIGDELIIRTELEIPDKIDYATLSVEIPGGTDLCDKSVGASNVGGNQCFREIDRGRVMYHLPTLGVGRVVFEERVKCWASGKFSSGASLLLSRYTSNTKLRSGQTQLLITPKVLNENSSP